MTVGPMPPCKECGMLSPFHHFACKMLPPRQDVVDVLRDEVKQLTGKLDKVTKDLAMTSLQAELECKGRLEAEAALAEERQEHKATGDLFRQARERIEAMEEQADAKWDLRAELHKAELQVRAVFDAGVKLEEAYIYNARMYHNINDWDEECHKRAQDARDALHRAAEGRVAENRYREPKGKDILGSLPDLPDPAEKRLCGACKKAPAEWECPGRREEIPERLNHEPHVFCGECDRGIGCAMIGNRLV
jgi:hypothetical protein